jgi:ribosomal protein L37AE/L43A
MTGQYHATFAVLTNQFKADHHANHHRCDCCGRLASVVNLGGIWVCSGCLSQAHRQLSKVVLREVSHGS